MSIADMKIVINSLSARLGGGQTYLRNLLAYLPERPDLFVVVYSPASLSLPCDPRIHIRKVGWFAENPLLRSLWERFILPRVLAREQADVLFCPGGVIMTKAPSGCRTVTMFRNMIPFDPEVLGRIPIGLQKIRNLLLRRIMLRSMEGADLTIFISNYARGIIESQVVIRNAVTIPHGIGDSFRTYERILDKPAWLPTGEYILYVSRFDVYKHQFEVASAFASLPENLSHRYKLLMVGEIDESLSRQVSDLAKNSGLEDQILIIGPVEYTNLPAAYHHATVNLFASSCENCPNILLEALGAGRPVLASEVMPMPEFGADAVEYFSPTDPRTIADAMVRVLQDESLRSALGAAAARRSNDFNWASTSRETWAHIYRLTEL